MAVAWPPSVAGHLLQQSTCSELALVKMTPSLVSTSWCAWPWLGLLILLPLSLLRIGCAKHTGVIWVSHPASNGSNSKFPIVLTRKASHGLVEFFSISGKGFNTMNTNLMFQALRKNNLDVTSAAMSPMECV